MKQDYTFLIGGEAGQGLQTIGAVLAKALARRGLHIFAYQDYHSRVRGGHNFFQIRAASFPVGSHLDELTILVALDEETIKIHRHRVAEAGVVLYDSGEIPDQEGLANPLPVPLSELGKKYGGRTVMGNTAAVGAIWQLLQGEPEDLEETLRDIFSSKGPDIAEANVKAARGGMEYAKDHFKATCPCRMEGLDSPPRMLLTGNDAVALGALAAGCQFVSAYPMSPATSVFTTMGRNVGRLPLVFEQAEDEIAAIHMAMGASFAGVRSMVPTSGGGLALMVEGLSLAGCTETPLVIFLGQRPGPATGLATRTEQGDLLFVLHAGHGEFPRAILAPGNPVEAFWLTVKAFNLAEKYQIPVFILSDQYLADALYTVEPFDLSRVRVERGEILTEKDLQGAEYLRHRLTDTGISPRAFPGGGAWTTVTSGNEHDEKGYPTEKADLRKAMVEKRLRKARPLAREIGSPAFYGPANPQKVLLTWGSTFGACREAADLLKEDGEDIGVVHMTELWPFPSRQVQEALKGAEVITVEMNGTGQLGRLLRQETGIQPASAVLKYDGRAMNAAFILKELEKGGVNPW